VPLAGSIVWAVAMIDYNVEGGEKVTGLKAGNGEEPPVVETSWLGEP